MFKQLSCLGAALVVTAGALASQPARADSVSDFYSGKTVTFIVAASVGGGYNLYSRILMDYMPRHIPGKPTVVVQNMGGAGGVKAANYMFNVAAKDGSVLGMPISSIVVGEGLRPAKVKFSTREFGWVGTITTMTDVLAVYADTGIRTIEDAKKKSVIIGATGKLGNLYLQPALVNALLGTKFTLVEGYKSGTETNLAMDRREVLGRTNQWTSWNTQRPHWIKENKLSYLLQFGPKNPALGDVPSFRELVKTPEKRAMVEFLELIQYVGRSAHTPPGVAKERLAALRQAFDATMRDPDYVARMKDKNLIMNPRPGTELQAHLDRVMPSARDLARRIKAELKLK